LLVAGLGDDAHPVGRACVAPDGIEPAMVKADCFRFRLDRRRVVPEFVAYQLAATATATSGAMATGATRTRMNLTTTATRSLAIPLIDEQHGVVTFLDRETARIDALIAKKERLIELLQEKRTALITHAVTKGLDPTVPMKDSGVEWLGEIPAHWKPTKIKRLYRQTKRQGHQDLTVLSVYREHGVIEKSSRDDNFNRTPEDLSTYQLVEIDDLVINKMKAWQGSLGVSTYSGITSPDYIVYSPSHSANSRFLHYFLRNKLLAQVYLTISNGIRPSQWRLEPEHFENLAVFIPPIAEQVALCAYLDSAAGKTDALVESIASGLDRLKEYRTALISAAVTGKIDVRDELAS
jgi:type I restriction enzyme S subunit